MHICIDIDIDIYMFVCKERERASERERERDLYIYLYIHIHIHIEIDRQRLVQPTSITPPQYEPASVLICVSSLFLASVRPNLVPCFNLVLPSLELSAHTFRALESCWHAGEGLPCCPVTSRGSSDAANGRAGEEYQVRTRYQVRANPLLGG